uniref:F-box domain-containing protein n=1 Tax=Tetradesmus obliquus TaxID=3088 RepID=A0A383WIA2_TETOB|eukprot:jgi/Sobl393_1/8336/SZX76973.1
MEEEMAATALPLDVVQIVLGYLTDSRSVAAARQACSSWRQAAAAAPCAVRVVLPSGVANMRDKLTLLLRLMPGLSGLQANVAAGSDTAYTSTCLQDILAFQNLRQLELAFADSQELATPDISQLASLRGLTALRLSNVSLSAAADSGPLSALQNLQELSLVHHSKVSALMVGDSHLQVLGKLAGLKSLVLQGRMCSATDEGLLALSGLAGLSSLSISWVPWQSQITQPAALQLLASFTQLKSLHLGGAELLLPSTPYHPVAAVPAPTPAGAPAGHHAALHQLGLMGQQQGLIAAAVAAVAGAAPPARPAGSSAGGAAPALSTAGSLAGHTQGEQMRAVLAAKSNELQEFKLQFNCCGTGVEKALVSLGEVRRKLTGLQWSYAKLFGPSSVNLLASCTNLRSLKLRLWYQDYNLTPFDFNLLDLSQLAQLRTLVIDKRPPFQQQLPAQQSAISMPITTGMLTKLSRCWPHLEKLQLGLARSDFGHAAPLEGLAGFSQLRSLSVHCYDQGYDDGHFMLPINVAALPSSLVKLDLMHAELFSSNGSSSQGLARHSGSGRSGSSSAAGYGSSYLMSSSSSISGLKSHSSIGDDKGSRSVSAGGACGCSSSSSSLKGAASGRPMARSDGGSSSSRGTPFGTAGGFTSMLSESFSLLSRQASAECSAAYLSTLMAQREEQHGANNNSSGSGSSQGGAAAGCSAHAAACSSSSSAEKGSTGSAGAAASSSAAAAAAASGSGLPPTFSLARGGSGLTENHSGWLQELLNDSSSRAARADTSGGSSSSSVLPRQPSLPPLPRQQSLSAPGSIPSAPRRSSSAAAQQALGCASTARQTGKTALLPTAERQIGSAGGAGSSIGVPSASACAAPQQQQQQQQQQQVGAQPRRQNPFAAAAAAAAVAAEVGGCVAAVDPHSAEEEAAAAAATSTAAAADASQARGLTSSSSAFAKVQEDLNNTSGSGSSSGSTLGMSFSLGSARSFSKGSSSSKAAAAAEAAAAAAWEAARNSSAGWEAPPGLPLLQHLQLKHCALDGIGLEDVITAPGELRSLQLVEVVGLSPRDIALMPCLASLLRLTLIAAKEDAWLGLAPLRLLSKLPELRHLDWVVSERALPARSKATDLQALLQFGKLQVITLHTVLGKCETLHAVSGQLLGGCHVRLMAPAYCEHASRKGGSRISRLLGAASCLIPGTGC